MTIEQENIIIKVMINFTETIKEELENSITAKDVGTRISILVSAFVHILKLYKCSCLFQERKKWAGEN